MGLYFSSAFICFTEQMLQIGGCFCLSNLSCLSDKMKQMCLIMSEGYIMYTVKWPFSDGCVVLNV